MGWTKLTDLKDREIGVVGDKGWDLASTFLDDFKKLYLKEFNRLPNEAEILQSVKFVFNEEMPD